MAQKPPVNAPVRVLTWDDIDQADDLPVEDVAVPEWGGDGAVVKVKALSRGKVVELFEESTDQETGAFDQVKMLSLLVIAGMHEPQITPDRLAQLNRKHSAPLKRISDRVKDLSGIGDTDEEIEARFPDG